jgi:uncharacterized protein YndB with AHSA1/START domain
MSTIVSTVEIDRPQQEVFSYVTDPSTFGEWQANVISGSMQKDGPPGVGSKCLTSRRIGGTNRTTTQVVSEYDPPRRWSVRGVDGPIRADVTATVAIVDGGATSKVTIELAFHGHGIGRLFAPFVVAQARREVPQSCQRLKTQLELPSA